MKLWERVEYSAIVDRAPLRLPDGGRVVVWPIVTVEVWDPDRPLPRTVLSPPSGGSFIPDVPNWTWSEYGMRVGFWRVKAVLDRLGITPTLSLNALVCDRYPRIAEAALEAGWEFMRTATSSGPCTPSTTSARRSGGPWSELKISPDRGRGAGWARV